MTMVSSNVLVKIPQRYSTSLGLVQQLPFQLTSSVQSSRLLEVESATHFDSR